MSLILALLQPDYIVVAADNRHTRGDPNGGLYKNDKGVKTVEIMNRSGVLGFAGHDFGENIISRAKLSGSLDISDTFRNIAEKFSQFAREEYTTRHEGHEFQPTVEIMLVGWLTDYLGKEVAAAYPLRNITQFTPFECTYPYRRFEVIGKSCHGALYGLHRFGNRDLPLEIGLRLAAWCLWEICAQDTTTGGDPQLYVIPRGGKVERQSPEKVSQLTDWAIGVGEHLENEFGGAV